MYARFCVLNHSKYRFPFNVVYIGIMNRIRKPTFHAARYNRQKYLGSDVRSRPLQSAPRVCFGARRVVILHRERPVLESRSGGFSKFSQKISAADFCYRQITASCTFVCRKTFRHTKVLALRGRAFSRVERLFNRYYGYQPKTDRHDRKEASNTEL